MNKKRLILTGVFVFLIIMYISIASFALEIVEAPVLDDEPAIVGIARGEDQIETTRKAIEYAGGLDDIINEGDTVLIKPNIVGAHPKGIGKISDYRTVQEVVNLVNTQGAEKIYISESPVDARSFNSAMEITGFVNIEGAVLYNHDGSRQESKKIKSEVSLLDHGIYLPEKYLEVDKVIVVSVMKTHNEAGVTLSLKNIGMGMPPLQAYNPSSGNKAILHEYGINNVIVDVGLIRHVDFSIIDGIIGGEGEGPLYVDPKKSNVIVAGNNIVSVDTIGTKIMGYNPERIPHIVYAASKDLGSMNNIEVKGDSISDIGVFYKRPSNNQNNVFQATSVILKNKSGDIKRNNMRNNINLQEQIVEGRENWSDTSDLSATFDLAVDNQNIYVYMNIYNNSVTNDDIVEIVFNGRNNFSYFSGSKMKISNILDDPETPENIKLEREIVDEGYILEITIPRTGIWNNLSHLQTYGFDVILHDYDQEGNLQTKMQWNNGENVSRFNNHLGRVFIDIQDR